MLFKELEPRLLEFERWLIDRGAVVLDTTNPHEVVRFKTTECTSIIYRKDSGRLTLVGEAMSAWQGFCGQNNGWIPGVQKARRNLYSKFVPALRARDGDGCFYCLEPLGEDVTVEHLVARGVGGPNHIDNFVLAHQRCNQDGGILPVVQKLKTREQNLMKRIHYHGG